MEYLNLILNALPDVCQALLAILGGLKLISRYTPWEWDDKVLGVVEAPLVWVASVFKKK